MKWVSPTVRSSMRSSNATPSPRTRIRYAARSSAPARLMARAMPASASASRLGANTMPERSATRARISCVISGRRTQGLVEGGGLRGGEESLQVVDQHQTVVELGHPRYVRGARSEGLGCLDGGLIGDQVRSLPDSRAITPRAPLGHYELVGLIERLGGPGASADVQHVMTRPRTLTTPSRLRGVGHGRYRHPRTISRRRDRKTVALASTSKTGTRGADRVGELRPSSASRGDGDSGAVAASFRLSVSMMWRPAGVLLRSRRFPFRQYQLGLPCLCTFAHSPGGSPLRGCRSVLGRGGGPRDEGVHELPRDRRPHHVAAARRTVC